jgi:hypothetical protein
MDKISCTALKLWLVGGAGSVRLVLLFEIYVLNPAGNELLQTEVITYEVFKMQTTNGIRAFSRHRPLVDYYYSK